MLRHPDFFLHHLDSVYMSYFPVKEIINQAQHFTPYEQMIIGINHCLGFNKYKQDLEKGRTWIWVSAAYYGLFIAQYNWALTWTESPSYNIEHDISVDEIKVLAEKNDLAALYMLGVYFTECDPELAVQCYQKAADSNFYPAINNLADKYETGSGVEQNIHKAIELYEIAAQQHIAAAEWSLGLIYFNGELINQDLELAKYWLTKADNNGWPQAQELLDVLDEN